LNHNIISKKKSCNEITIDLFFNTIALNGVCCLPTDILSYIFDIKGSLNFENLVLKIIDDTENEYGCLHRTAVVKILEEKWVQKDINKKMDIRFEELKLEEKQVIGKYGSVQLIKSDLKLWLNESTPTHNKEQAKKLESLLLLPLDLVPKKLKESDRLSVKSERHIGNS